MIRIFLFMMCVAVANNCYAGSRSGFRLVVVDLHGSLTPESKDSVVKYFDGFYSSEFYSCVHNKFNKTIDVELAYINSRPKKLTDILVVKSLSGDDRSFSRLKRLLASYRDAEIDRGFDALVVFQRWENGVNLNVVSPWDKTIRKAVSFRSLPNQIIQPAELRYAFCSAFGELGYAYGE